MSRAFDDAVSELYQAPLASFVAERKRLAKELSKEDGKRFAKLARPPISAWVVNQLWWHARDAFDALLATAEKLRKGQLAAGTAHRDAIAKLRARAATILTDAGHGATESTLRRVTQTLAAVAATGGFDPDPPGALSADRDPPGFEAVGIVGPSTADEATEKPARAAASHHAKAHAAKVHEDKARAEATAAAERRRIEEQRAKQKAERHRVEAALRTAKGDVHTREREIEKLEKELSTARDRLDRAKEVVDDLEAKLASLAN